MTDKEKELENLEKRIDRLEKVIYKLADSLDVETGSNGN